MARAALTVLLPALVAAAAAASRQQLAGPSDAAPAAAPAPAVDPAGNPGALLIAGGGRLPAEVRRRFIELAGGDGAEVVLLPTASATADDASGRESLAAGWRRDFPAVTFHVVHTRDRAQADDPALLLPLQRAGGVWIGGGQQERLAAAYAGTGVERQLRALLARGGVVGGTSAGAAIQCRTMIERSADGVPVVARGFDLLPHAVIDQHFLRRDRLPRLQQVLREHPGHFGLGVDEGTAVLVTGRTLRVLGDSKAVLLLAAGGGHDERRLDLSAGQVADLPTWQRAALRRAEAPWPAVLLAPRVAAGSLVLVGGGAIPDAIVDRFVALAGGTSARIVLVQSAAEAPGDEDPIAARLRQRGVDSVATLHHHHPRDVDTAALQRLFDATGVWFSGGRQWRLVDAYAGTPALVAFQGVLARGGVIGGTSAGATIQGEFLVRGNPAGNEEMWCEAYDRGFGFLPGVAVDQHFVARGRTGDLQGLIARLPQLVGLGIDEATAAVVTGAMLEVLGTGKVAVFDVRALPPHDRVRPEPAWLAPGARWDLVAGAEAASR